MLVNAGAAVVNINVLANGLTTFTRDVTMGGNQFTEEIQKQLNVCYDEAEKLKVGGDRGDADSVVPQEVERVIQGVADQMAGEIQRSLDFYTAPRPTRTSPASISPAAPPRSRALQDHRAARGRAGGDPQSLQGRSRSTTAASTPTT